MPLYPSAPFFALRCILRTARSLRTLARIALPNAAFPQTDGNQKSHNIFHQLLVHQWFCCPIAAIDSIKAATLFGSFYAAEVDESAVGEFLYPTIVYGYLFVSLLKSYLL